MDLKYFIPDMQHLDAVDLLDRANDVFKMFPIGTENTYVPDLVPAVKPHHIDGTDMCVALADCADQFTEHAGLIQDLAPQGEDSG
jgi:hypothetical protein